MCPGVVIFFPLGSSQFKCTHCGKVPPYWIFVLNCWSYSHQNVILIIHRGFWPKSYSQNVDRATVWPLSSNEIWWRRHQNRKWAICQQCLVGVMPNLVYYIGRGPIGYPPSFMKCGNIGALYQKNCVKNIKMPMTSEPKQICKQNLLLIITVKDPHWEIMNSLC